MAIAETRDQLWRFVVVGLLATFIHYAVLVFCMDILSFQKAWLANVIAAFVAMSFSFIANRHFVFSSEEEKWWRQARKFGSVYFFAAIIHSLIILLLVDIMLNDYRLSFIAATTFQFFMTFTLNKIIVFKK